MDFPIFHLDFLNNRVLIAIIAILHVLINHALAVGFIPMVTFMEWLGFKTQDERWDRLAYKINASYLVAIGKVVFLLNRC